MGAMVLCVRNGRKAWRTSVRARNDNNDTRGAPSTPAAVNDNSDPVAAIVARYEERTAALVRDLVADLRAAQRRPSRGVVLAEPLAVRKLADAADELTRARARSILDRAAKRGAPR